MAIIQKHLDAFARTHPGVKATFLTTAGTGTDYWSKLKAMLAAGQGPDIFLVEPDRLAEFVANGVAQPLDELVRRDRFDLSDFFPKALEQYRVGNRQYGLPYGFGNRDIGYNVDLFNEAGLAPLPDDWRSPQWTFADVRVLAKKLTQVDPSTGEVRRYGLVASRGDRGLGAWLYANGAAYVRAEGDRLVSGFRDPALVEVLELLQQLTAAERVMQSGGWRELATGKAAMAEVQPANVRSLRQAIGQSFTWDVAPWPAGRAGHRTAGGGTAWVLSSQSKHLALAWEVYKVLVGRPVQQEIMEAGHLAPGRRSVAFSPSYRANRPPASIQVFAQAPEFVQPDPVILGWADFWQVANTHLRSLWDGSKPARTVAEQIDRDTAPILAKAGTGNL